MPGSFLRLPEEAELGMSLKAVCDSEPSRVGMNLHKDVSGISDPTLVSPPITPSLPISVQLLLAPSPKTTLPPAT